MKFMLNCLITVSAYAVVEAENEEEALKMANRGELDSQLDDSCRFKPLNTWIVEEPDGDPEEITSSGECDPGQAEDYE